MLGQKLKFSSFRFFEELKTPKFPFKINGTLLFVAHFESNTNGETNNAHCFSIRLNPRKKGTL